MCIVMENYNQDSRHILMQDSMRGNFKSWVLVLAPFVLILAVVLWSVQEKTYKEEAITPELCQELILADFAERHNTVDRERLEIIDIQKVDEDIIVGFYYPDYTSRSDGFYFMQLCPYHGGYYMDRIEACWKLDIPELAHGDFMTNIGINSTGESGYYYIFLSKAENLRRVEMEENYQSDGSVEIDRCPAMLILPRFQPDDPYYVGTHASRYSFRDAAGEEIAYFNIESSYDVEYME